MGEVQGVARWSHGSTIMRSPAHGRQGWGRSSGIVPISLLHMAPCRYGVASVLVFVQLKPVASAREREICRCGRGLGLSPPASVGACRCRHNARTGGDGRRETGWATRIVRSTGWWVYGSTHKGRVGEVYRRLAETRMVGVHGSRGCAIAAICPTPIALAHRSRP